MKLVSLPVVSAFAPSTFQPSLPQVKMQEHRRFACKSLKFKHTAYACWLDLSVPFFNSHTLSHTVLLSLTHTQSCTANPTLDFNFLKLDNLNFPWNTLQGNSKTSRWQIQLHTHTQRLYIHSLAQLLQVSGKQIQTPTHTNQRSPVIWISKCNKASFFQIRYRPGAYLFI